MFNFNTQKKQSSPAVSAPNSAVPTPNTNNTAQLSSANQGQDAYIDNRLKEIDLQRIEFMKKNPNFDMQSELKNEKFLEYVIKNELSVEDAYFLTHRDEIIDNAIKESLSRISERKNRITENGASKNSPAVVNKNPKDMTDKEIDSIIERVNNGEKISF